MQKLAGQPCPECNTPFIDGQYGPYCKPCFVASKNSENRRSGRQTLAQQNPPQPVKPEVDPEIWKAKDRMNIAQSAQKNVAMVHEGSGKPFEQLELEMTKYYRWLMAKKTNGDEIQQIGEKINLDEEDIGL